MSHLTFSKFFLSVTLCAFGLTIAKAEPTISMAQIIRDSRHNISIKIAKNDVRNAKLEIQKLRSESSLLLQARMKGGIYQHFSYDGIDKRYITRPDIGIKYYLFGGNKYQKHIIAEAEPKYYDEISNMDAAQRRTISSIKRRYSDYWKHYEIAANISKIIRLIINTKSGMDRHLRPLVKHLRLEKYLSKMQDKMILIKIRALCDTKVQEFRPIFPAIQNKHQQTYQSLFHRHPGLEGLVRYYRSRRKLGWLRFLDVKFKLFLRPSYYPSAGKTKMAVIGGVYLTMPIDILGAVRKENQQLSLSRQNIILKLNSIRRKVLGSSLSQVGSWKWSLPSTR